MKWAMFSGLSVCLLLLWFAYETFRRKQEKHRVELIMAKRFIDGLEKERTRLAKELHDGICNDLLAIGMMLNLKEKDTETLRAISQSLESVRQDVRAVSHELTPPKFQDASLDEILENQMATVLAQKVWNFLFQNKVMISNGRNYRPILHMKFIESYKNYLQTSSFIRKQQKSI